VASDAKAQQPNDQAAPAEKAAPKKKEKKKKKEKAPAAGSAVPPTQPKAQ
jgi:hypothetical protein